MTDNKDGLLEQLEIKKKESEITLAQLQIEELKRDAKHSNSFLGRMNISVPIATVIVGILSFLGSTAGTYFVKKEELRAQREQKHSEFNDQLQLKQKELESQLLLAALKDDDKKKNLEKISFLIDAGYLSDEKKKITQVIASGKYGELALPMPDKFFNALYNGKASGILNEIMNIAGEKIKDKKILLSEAERYHPIASVTINENGHYTLTFDKTAVQALAGNRKSNWMVALVLSHELGHIALGHLDGTKRLCFKVETGLGIADCESRKNLELAADRFSGCVLRVLGSDIDELTKTFNDSTILMSGGAIDFPSGKERIEAIQQGWRSLKGSSCDS